MSSIKKILELLVGELQPAHFAALRGLIRDSVRLVPEPVSEEALPLGASRLGGEPDLPRATPWPTHGDKPLAFLAQVNVSDLHAIAGKEALPAKGLLSFFYDAEAQPRGYDPKDAGTATVLFTEALEGLVRREVPSNLSEECRFKPRAVKSRAEMTLPDAGSPELTALALTDEEVDAYLEAHEEEDDSEPRHRLLGHPDPMQGEMRLQAQLVTNGLSCGDAEGYADPRAEALKPGAADWRLLFQLDSDEDAGMMWGDLGRLYFWIREEDLRAHRFGKSWTILQCG